MPSLESLIFSHREALRIQQEHLSNLRKPMKSHQHYIITVCASCGQKIDDPRPPNDVHGVYTCDIREGDPLRCVYCREEAKVQKQTAEKSMDIDPFLRLRDAFACYSASELDTFVRQVAGTAGSPYVQQMYCALEKWLARPHENVTTFSGTHPMHVVLRGYMGDYGENEQKIISSRIKILAEKLTEKTLVEEDSPVSYLETIWRALQYKVEYTSSKFRRTENDSHSLYRAITEMISKLPDLPTSTITSTTGEWKILKDALSSLRDKRVLFRLAEEVYHYYLLAAKSGNNNKGPSHILTKALEQWIDFSDTIANMVNLSEYTAALDNNLTDNLLVPIPKALFLLINSHNGDTGAAQQRLAKIGTEIVTTLLRKNADYGDTGQKPPILAKNLSADVGLLVRMSDKFARLETLLNGNKPEVEESVNDTMLDLAGYCILYLVTQSSPEEDEAENENIEAPTV